MWSLTVCQEILIYLGDETSSPANVKQMTDEKRDDGDDNDDIDKEEEEQDTSTADVDLDEARLLSMTDDNKSGIITELVL